MVVVVIAVVGSGPLSTTMIVLVYTQGVAVVVVEEGS